MRSWSTFKNPLKWGSISNKPAILADNEIDWGEISGQISRVLPSSKSHIVSNPDVAPEGFSCGDALIPGYPLHGYNFLTLNSSSRSGYTSQLALSDTGDIFLFRRKSFGVWYNWTSLI